MNKTEEAAIDHKINDNIDLSEVIIENDSYYRISNVDKMRPFFMSIVSDSNHWMFISSNGGLSAGRKNAEYALFPYYTDDKLTESNETTGSKTVLRIKNGPKSVIWEPFSDRMFGAYRYSRNLYKGVYGNKILFEEINHDLELTFRYEWSSSNQFGFIRQSFLINNSSSKVHIEMLDGIQNIMPYGVNPDLQAIRSNLVDAYKKSELIKEVGLGIYTLSAIIVDRAEPSEALKANIAWSIGLDNPTYLLSSQQLPAFRNGDEISQEVDMKAERGAYFVSQEVQLDPSQQKHWMIIANVNQGPAAISDMISVISNSGQLAIDILNDIGAGTERLLDLVAAADGIQLTADKKGNGRHFANTLFNIMRGGIFDHNYVIEKRDFATYLKKANSTSCQNNLQWLKEFPDTFSLQFLKEKAQGSGDPDLIRLALEYMPLKFSRRHGDPSRPWNKFSINTRNETDGSKVLDYEGNWRDIFQNWEALAHAYPEYIEGMICKFLNASTFDGYNPYRVTKDGFDWEVIEPHDPWSYIGYWGDHQIIYLLKFLEFIRDHYPERLVKYFDQDIFVYANVPYRIKPYEEILKDPKDTILFDHESDREIQSLKHREGADGALLKNSNNEVHRVNFLEKTLATVLAKISNFIPEAGIWLNTQRPEWNDANNALVGNGVSVVTLCYLRRFLKFWQGVLPDSTPGVQISEELAQFFQEVKSTLTTHSDLLSESLTDSQRKTLLDSLGNAGSTYREKIYNQGFSSIKAELSISELQDFVKVSLSYLDHTIRANRRDDNMYHAYNLMAATEKEVSISHLDEMLEGQVAVLSSGYLSSKECLLLLDSMKGSRLFRQDQYSYLLYPNKELIRFVDKNVIPSERVQGSPLLKKLLEDGNNEVIQQSITGQHHFNGNFNNAKDLEKALVNLSSKGYSDLTEKYGEDALEIFEEVFNHKAFTGRSGTFFGYEGLGSIYWHMVSKLLLAVEECCLHAIQNNESDEVIGRLLEHFYEIMEGIGVHKSPELYGAFPTDPYSHTPSGKGAQQPGMTGQVKEDLLSRMGELGISVKQGIIQFSPQLLRKAEFLKEDKIFHYVDVESNRKEMPLPTQTLAFTYCQIPVVYQIGVRNHITVSYHHGEELSFDKLQLDLQVSQQIFGRTGDIKSIKVELREDQLK